MDGIAGRRAVKINITTREIRVSDWGIIKYHCPVSQKIRGIRRNAVRIKVTV